MAWRMHRQIMQDLQGSEIPLLCQAAVDTHHWAFAQTRKALHGKSQPPSTAGPGCSRRVSAGSRIVAGVPPGGGCSRGRLGPWGAGEQGDSFSLPLCLNLNLLEAIESTTMHKFLSCVSFFRKESL